MLGHGRIEGGHVRRGRRRHHLGGPVLARAALFGGLALVLAWLVASAVLLLYIP
jgi:hypothetical protein